MRENSTHSMLQRVPVILAVTASSYGLEPRPGGGKPLARAGHQPRPQRTDAATGKPAAQR